MIPLSPNSGLIGWVPHCDTLHTLIRDYREKKKILLNIEHRIMLRMAQDYDHLTVMQKVEVFEHALEHTNGDDLAKLLWLKSPSSEVFFFFMFVFILMDVFVLVGLVRSQNQLHAIVSRYVDGRICVRFGRSTSFKRNARQIERQNTAH